MRAPTVHLNGTAGHQLLSAAIEAREAAEQAIGKIVAAAPNARDYYPQGEAAYTIALADYQRVAGHLQQVVDELAELCWNISEQVREQEENRQRRRRT